MEEALENALKNSGFNIKEVKSIKCHENITEKRIKNVCKILLRDGSETDIEQDYEMKL